MDEFDLFSRPLYKPRRLNSLCSGSKFTKGEIKQMYQGFKSECPNGLCDEHSFKSLFSQFFPTGDASSYARHVFNTWKYTHQRDVINFEEFLAFLSSLIHGSREEKIKWIFLLYDINRDGIITMDEMVAIVDSIYQMLGNFTAPIINERSAKDHAVDIFQDEVRCMALGPVFETVFE